MTFRKAAEDIAQATVPVPVSVSGLTILGITLQDWVFIATGILLVFQLIVIVPKALGVIKSTLNRRFNDRK